MGSVAAVNEFEVKPLDIDTWTAFADLVVRNGGVWGGCWCLGFHPEGGSVRGFDARRDAKLQRVREGTTHNALVFDGDVCLGWCQFGSPEELTRIKFGKVYKSVPSELPDWRITCFYVDKKGRHRGVADAALAGALQMIAELGGGRVESSPEDVTGRKVSNSFLYNATTSIFERHGFTRVRQLGKNNWLVSADVAPA